MLSLFFVFFISLFLLKAKKSLIILIFTRFALTLPQHLILHTMNTITIKDKTFKTFIPEEEILKNVKAVAERINNDLAGKNPLFLAVLQT